MRDGFQVTSRGPDDFATLPKAINIPERTISDRLLTIFDWLSERKSVHRTGSAEWIAFVGDLSL